MPPATAPAASTAQVTATACDDRARTKPGTEHPQETGRLADALYHAVLRGDQHGGEAHDDRCRRKQPAQLRCAADVTESGEQGCIVVAPLASMTPRPVGLGGGE
jgi:hypothetical protein